MSANSVNIKRQGLHYDCSACLHHYDTRIRSSLFDALLSKGYANNTVFLFKRYFKITEFNLMDFIS